MSTVTEPASAPASGPPPEAETRKRWSRVPAVLPPAPGKTGRRKKPLPPAPERPLYVTTSIVTTLTVLLLTFVATMAVIGPVKHARDQQTAFATVRGTLANATAPVTQLDQNGDLYPKGTPIGVLDIPQLELREVLLEGTTSSVLQSGVGHRRDTPFPGQEGTSLVFGRQAAFGGPFRALGQMTKGQVFSITTGQGRQVFRVVAVRHAGDLQPPAVAAGKSRVTLITAAGRAWTPEGLLRVDADLVTPVQPAGARPLTPGLLPEPEKYLKGDPTVWVTVMLLVQALLAVSVFTTWARYRWGRWQTWITCGPLLAAIGVALSEQVAALLPNLM